MGIALLLLFLLLHRKSEDKVINREGKKFVRDTRMKSLTKGKGSGRENDTYLKTEASIIITLLQELNEKLEEAV
jgi:hypothetical protein